ncbi:helix-turn-helix transcriptional regulator [Alcaligenaceae bacterium SJ-26]|nr:helix-turn-helix transcriptional regulator [Alcaligenaceae bacterium SJ-26]
MRFGEWLKQERQRQHLTGAALARKAGLSQSYISALENGTRSSPTLYAAIKLADGIGIPLWVALKHNKIKR